MVGRTTKEFRREERSTFDVVVVCIDGRRVQFTLDTELLEWIMDDL